MKIDVHVHTKKTKSGDAATREIDPKRFAEIVTSTDVKIIAITNHNIFDIEQYNEIRKEINEAVQIWPGIELDVVENNRRGHLIVIVSPNDAVTFSNTIGSLTKDTTPDDFTISIDDVLNRFDTLEPVYIAHYNQKKPNITDDDINKIIERTKHKNRVIKEVTNSISAGIYISHGYPSIYGSDLQDWNKYQALSNELPELRLPVESFEQFCLLLDKDQKTIETVLDRKTAEIITIQPFEDSTTLDLKIYNDINVFFGSKGTGKSKILEAIGRYYSEKGITANVFESGASTLAEKYGLNSKSLSVNLEDYSINYCTSEIEFIKKSKEENITNIYNYQQYFSNITQNKNAKRISIKDFSKEDIDKYKREQKSVDDVFDVVEDFKEFSDKDTAFKKIIGKDLTLELNDLIIGVRLISEVLLQKRPKLPLIERW